ncbi:hypothetical protein [uncultured Mediterranean phage uvMED]|nr:hypothetical protein [uncultured Mediterranean phage uvMED]
MAEVSFDLSPEEEELIRRRRAQQQIANLAPEVAPIDQSRLTFEAPESFGEGLTNFAQRAILNPIQERLGMRDSLPDMLTRARIQSEINEQNEAFRQFSRQELLRQELLSLPGLSETQKQIISATGPADLMSFAQNIQGGPTIGSRGEVLQTSPLTGAQTVITSPTTDTQSAIESRMRFSADSDSPTVGQLRRQEANLGKIDESAFTRIAEIEKASRDGFAKYGERTAAEEVFAQLIADPNVQFGTGQELIDSFRGLGVNLAGTIDPGLAGSQLFTSVFSSLIGPRVKEMGRNPTDVDLAFVSKQAPQLSNTREGNALIIEFLKIATDRASKRQKLVSEFQLNPDNRQLKARNPELYRLNLENAIAQQERDPEYIGPNLTALKAQAADLLGIDPITGLEALLEGTQ